MKPDTARFLSSAVVVLCVVTLVILAAVRCPDFEAYVATVCLAILAGFVASTQDA
jgi:hypothetical protein